MTEHSDDCCASLDGEEPPCTCGLAELLAELKLLREAEQKAQAVSMSAVGGVDSGAPPMEDFVLHSRVDALRAALAALDAWRKTQ